MKKTIITLCLLFSPALCLADSPWGVNMHLRERVPEADWNTLLDKAQTAQISWVREEFNWDVIEPTDNDFSFSQYDAVVSAYQSRDMQILGLITYSASWASTNPGSMDSEFYPPEENAWQDYVYQLALHYQDSINYWEIWNEPNYSGFWKGTPEEYANYLALAATEIKRANPDAKIVLGGLSGTDTDWLAKIIAEIGSDDFDLIAIHPYRVINGDYDFSPEYTTDGLNTFLADLRNLKAYLRGAGIIDKNIWLTEIGWTTYSEGVNKRTQKNMLLRSFAQALTVEGVKKVFWYDFRDDSSADYLESGFGLLNYDNTEKTSYQALKFLNTYLRGYLTTGETILTNNTKNLDEITTLTGWSTTPNANSTGELSSVDGTLKVKYQFTGTENSYLQINKDLALSDNGRALSFRAKGDNSNNDLRFRIMDASGETFQYNVGKLGKEWLTYKIPLKYYSTSWGNNADGIIDTPAKFTGFVLDDSPDGNLTSGTLYFDDLKETADGNFYMYSYGGSETRYMFWNTTGAKHVRIYLGSAQKIRIYSVSGSTTLKTSTNGYFNLAAGFTPKLIRVIK